MKNIIFVFVLCLLIQGCATTSTLKFDPQALDGQEEISKDGVEAVVSQKKARVTIQPSAGTYTSRDRPAIVVSVYDSEEPFNFSPEDIQVFVDGNPHRIVPYDELVAEIKKREKSALKDLEMENDDRMRGAGGSAENVRYVEIQYQRDVEAVKTETRKSIRALDATMLKETTVSPGNEYSGQVTLDDIPNPSQPHEIKVIVTVAGEEHEFLLNHVRVQ
jgi:hypothetical protein